MAYERKTVDTWEVQTNYGAGFECSSTYLTFREARDEAKRYRQNQPRYEHRVKLVREPIMPKTN